MKLLQKFEVAFAAGYFISVLLYIYFIYIPSRQGIAKAYGESLDYRWQFAFFWFIVPGILMIIASYLHASKNNYFALGLILLWGGMFSFLTLLAVAIGDAFEGHPLIGISPGLCAFATVILAIANTVVRLKAGRNERV